MTRHRERQGAAPPGSDPRRPRPPKPSRPARAAAAEARAPDRPREKRDPDVARIYGFHSVEAALKASRRDLIRLYATAAAAERLKAEISARGVETRILSLEEVARARAPRRRPSGGGARSSPAGADRRLRTAAPRPRRRARPDHRPAQRRGDPAHRRGLRGRRPRHHRAPFARFFRRARQVGLGRPRACADLHGDQSRPGARRDGRHRLSPGRPRFRKRPRRSRRSRSPVRSRWCSARRTRGCGA